MNLTRAGFLKMCGGILSGAFIMTPLGDVTREPEKSPFFPKDKHKDGALTGLLDLPVEAHEGTDAVWFYMDDTQLCELADLYAKKTRTKPVWKTEINPRWFERGQHHLRVKADTSKGTVIIENRKVTTDRSAYPVNQILFIGAWRFASQHRLPSPTAEGESPAAVRAGFNVGKWATVMLPNSSGYADKLWNKFEGLVGVYRRSFEIDDIRSEEQFAIILEARYCLGRVFLNGNTVGSTKRGRLRSDFDITRHIHSGNNLIAVVVDNSISAMGVFNVSGGEYWNWGGSVQDYVERTPEAASTGICAEGRGSGKVTLYADGVNAGNAPLKLEACLRAMDPSSSYVLKHKGVAFDVPVGGGGIKALEFRIYHSALWDPEHPDPHMVTVGGRWGAVEKKVRTDFRDVCVSGEDILLTGKVIENLQGFNRESDYPSLGRTQPPGSARGGINELHYKGFQFFRPAHYSTTQDELGPLVIEQMEIVGLEAAQLGSKEVSDFAAEELKELIHRDHNHPSIIAWSLGNENRSDEEGAEEYIRDIIQLGKSLDPARLFRHVTDLGMDDRTYRYQDFVAHNFYAGSYDYDYDLNVNAVVALLDYVQSFSGNKLIVLSRYGAEAVIGRPGTGMGTEFYQGYVVDRHHRSLNKRKHFLGKKYWTSTEFWCSPTWAGGTPDLVPPFHVKGLKGYYRDYDKFGYRVMFSPIWLSIVGNSSLKQTMLGVSTRVTQGEKVKFRVRLAMREIRGERVGRRLIVRAPDGFCSSLANHSFKILPYGESKMQIELEDVFSKDAKQVDGRIAGVTDEGTEAQPMLVSIDSEE